uniref:LEM domain-containing protein n=1 Tax=Wuchereria bancrofti TaxID=6293 RepID=A0A1I8ERF2_WUCBA
MMDIDQLTNEEIRDQLMTYGCDPGPVVGSTRNVYANKLRRLLEGGSESNVVVPPEKLASDAVGADSLKSSPQHKDISHSPQISRSPRRATRSSVQEVTGLSKVQSIPLNSKVSRALPKTAGISPAKSRIFSDFIQSSPKPRVVQAAVPTPPKSRVDPEFEIHSEVSTGPESHGLLSKAGVTSESASLDITSPSKISKPYSFETIPEAYRTTPTTRFTSLRDNWGNGIVNDGSDDDLRGEESSRILLPSWKEDHAYSAGYDSKQGLMARRHLDANSAATHYNQTSRYNSGVAFENFYNGHGNRCNSLVNKQKASRRYGKIGLTLLFIITAVIFMFFVVQNYAELERGEGNKEEF